MLLRHREAPEPLLDPDIRIPVRDYSSETIVVALHVKSAIVISVSVAGKVGACPCPAAVSDLQENGPVVTACGVEAGDGVVWGNGAGGVVGVCYWVWDRS
jgi:hypothetical protein